MHQPIYTYCVPDCDPDTWFQIKTDPCADDESIAADAGEDYHGEHDGWEVEYPIKIMLRREDGTDAGTYEVYREMVPSFSAVKV